LLTGTYLSADRYAATAAEATKPKALEPARLYEQQMDQGEVVNE